MSVHQSVLLIENGAGEEMRSQQMEKWSQTIVFGVGETFFIDYKRNRTNSMQNTYSLKAILQSDLDPTLCKLMLHEIKSPLLEHSFQLTADDEQNAGSFSIPTYSEHSRYKPTVERGPSVRHQKREQWQQQKQFDRMHQKLNQLSLAMSENDSVRHDFNYPTNRTYDAAPLANQKDKHRHQLKKCQQIPQSSCLVSPLQYNPNIAPSNAQTNTQKQGNGSNNNFLLDNPSTFSGHISDNEKQDDGVAKWCGEVFHTENAYVNQIIFDYNPKLYRRKNIFPKKQQPSSEASKVQAYINRKSPSKPEHVTFSQAINRMTLINEPQVANFLAFVNKILVLFGKLSPHRTKLLRNQHIMTKMLIRQNPIDHETRQTISNKNRIINRLRVNKVSEALTKILESADSAQKDKLHKDRVEEDLQKMLQCYSEIEDVIENYVSRRDIVNELNTIYGLLYEFQILRINQLKQSGVSSKKQKSQPPILAQCLRQKLCKFLSCLQIEPESYSNLYQLKYIWSQINSVGSYLPSSQELVFKQNRQKFINELCRNDILIHESMKSLSDHEIERKLQGMGFFKNVD